MIFSVKVFWGKRWDTKDEHWILVPRIKWIHFPLESVLTIGKWSGRVEYWSIKIFFIRDTFSNLLFPEWRIMGDLLQDLSSVTVSFERSVNISKGEKKSMAHHQLFHNFPISKYFITYLLYHSPLSWTYSS